jgi:hypothetical protein
VSLGASVPRVEPAAIAVADAVGAELNELRLTPELVLAAVVRKDRRGAEASRR